jgi:GT2 family glycosyltransferase
MSATPIHNDRSSDLNRLSERGPWVSKLHIPRFLKWLLPPRVLQGLSDLKGRSIARDFPRDERFDQSPEERQASASMSVIVPIHDAPIVTSRCLASLERYAPESEIILVDDASSLAETLEVIRVFGGRNGWRIVRNDNSVGHSEACRAGARLATRSYLCLLNSDTVITPWCWRQIKEVFEDDEKIGVAGPSTSYSGNIQAISLAADLIACWNDNQICAFAKRLSTQFQERAVVDLDWIAGFAFFIRRSLWEQIGGFDHNLPDYGNEVELCARVAERGYRRVWIRNSYIHHFGQRSYGSTIGVGAITARTRAAEVYAKEKNKTVVP